ncbi:MAG: hypothetical protein ACE5FK_00230 [Candidatus Methylomirabilia bacterium]
MRLGYGGWAVLLGILLGLGVILAGGLIFSANIFYLPDQIPPPLGTIGDGRRAQQKMLEIVLRDRNVSSRTQPIVLTEKEINAFLSRHLEESEGIPFSRLRVEVSPETLGFQGRTRLRSLAKGIPFNYIAAYLPASENDRPVWLEMQAQVRLELGRTGKAQNYLRIEPTSVRVGAQAVSAQLLSWIVGGRFFRWAVPSVVEGVQMKDGRVIVTTRGR